MNREVYTISLYPRANGPVKAPSVARDVWEICQFGFLCFVYVVLAVLLLGGF
jgi:hypothetical protein